MTGTPTVAETSLHGLRLARRGKVRDVYEVDDRHLLVVATDRISAFGFARLAHITPHHLVTTDVNAMPEAVRANAELLRGRSMLVRRTEVFPVECVVRGYLAGSGWKDYLATGEVCGHKLPEGLKESAKLPAPIFTPATKAESGHDENISEERMRAVVGAEATEHLRDTALALYHEAETYARGRGIIIADTKFEFGRDEGGRIILIDEALTPDSSRFWPAAAYEPGHSQPSFDKQFVRDYLETLDWDKRPPAPPLPPETAAATTDRYLEAYRLLTGKTLLAVGD